ncbi:MAG: transposase [Rhodobacteraceae bacterium]|nr:transposase [Paracoccaceae bacterium]
MHLLSRAAGGFGADDCLLIGQWHPEAGARHQLRLDFMLFCGLDLFVPVPDGTTHCRFRNPR